ncbi:MAG TPA: MoxR family ATPase [Acidobacteriota bacterium]|nr:MoxR family ATPase [Acidobacteriota bacterium]
MDSSPPAIPATSRLRELLASVEKVIRGKPEVVRLAAITLLAKGHFLIEDVPGVGKTTLAYALARSFDCSFHRIQFTSDLLPSDLTGVSVYNQVRNQFEFRKGPLFANVILADEINRTTPKTQSALLEAMSEGKVTVEDQTYSLNQPFIVIATQNPIEHHGTYPLPESQLDRFLMRVRMGYPSEDHEKEILRSGVHYASADLLQPVISGEVILEAQKEVSAVRVDESLLDYLMALVRKTRESELLDLGVSPRGAMSLHRAAQARAYLDGRDFCVPDDIKALALPVFSHRVIVSSKFASPLNRSDEAESIIRDLMGEVEVPI